ncbi:MAG: CHAD domain-containing protein [Rhizobium sp.]|nr:CHAD domain-containing protein [Rhizobium sp.]
MKYSLDLDAPLEGEVRRVASARLDAAARLLSTQPRGLDEAIHDARRHIKQCRSLYRLVATGAKAFQTTENARLGDVGRRLSAMRDAKALVEVANYLKREIPTKANGLLMDRLARRLEHRKLAATKASDAATDTIASAATDLREAAMHAQALHLPHARRKAAACLARGWDRTGNKARDALEATGQGHDEAFHDLRKRSQDRWMQAGLLQVLWPTAMRSIQRQAKYLSDLLGHAQDLAVLLETVSETADLVGDTVESEAVREMIASQRGHLHKQCRQLAADVFGKSRPRDRAMIERLLLDR